jgi:CRISPR type III-A/MTUBE-associated protein Csm6
VAILISATGDSDPIRDFHDGALLHIARKYRPEKIVVIYSERTFEKREKIELAIRSIPDYNPMIISHDEVLDNNEVYQFDAMFEKISTIIQHYLEDGELILNLSSATPQIKSAFFVANRLNDLNVKAVQVLAPSHSSNEGIPHSNNEELQDLIENNFDNVENFEDRTVEDLSEKFSITLLKRNLKNLILHYDYKAALDMLMQDSSFYGLKTLRENLEDMVSSHNHQRIPRGLQKKKLSDDEKKILNSFLLIDLQKKRGNLSESLIRLKTLSEFLLEFIITKSHPNAIDDYLVENDKGTLNLLDYRSILKQKRMWALQNQIKSVVAVNKSRNQVAHSLEPLDAENIKYLGRALRDIKNLIREHTSIPSHLFEFYDQFNQECCELLKIKERT